MDDPGEDKAHRIYGNMLLSPLGFLARIITALPPFPALLTERESMMVTEGVLFLPAFCRASSRQAFMACSPRPSRRQRRKPPYTVCQGGKSFGNIRHWQPVFTTYSIPVTAARKSCFGGRPRRRTVGNGLTKWGANSFHWASVRSLAYIAFSRSVSHDLEKHFSCKFLKQLLRSCFRK
jgi:hypothetical protein